MEIRALNGKEKKNFGKEFDFVIVEENAKTYYTKKTIVDIRDKINNALEVCDGEKQPTDNATAILPDVRSCATLEEVEQLADKLTNEEREELIHRYCHGCGSIDNTCQCWNDE